MFKRKYLFLAEDNGGAGAAGGAGVETPAADSGMSDVNSDWADLSSDAPDGDVSVEAPAITTEPLAAPAAPPVAPPVIPAVAAEPPVVQPQTPQPAAQPEPQQPAPAARTTEEIAALRTQYVAELTQSYQLTPEEAQMMQTQPELVLPKMAADLHVRVLDAVAAQLPQRVYGMVNQIIESQRVEKAAEDEFFKGFEDLREHRAAVLQVGKLYRAANPTASKETAIQVIGNFVRTSLGLPTPNSQPSPQPVQQANPFIPAQNAGGGSMPASAPSLWEEMAKDDD